MAYAILKHESLWSTTDRAIVQQWPKGQRGRRAIIRVMEEILDSPELMEFMEGLDLEPLYADTITSRGWCTAIARLLCCALPARRVRCKHAAQINSAPNNLHNTPFYGRHLRMLFSFHHAYRVKCNTAASTVKALRGTLHTPFNSTGAFAPSSCRCVQ